MQGAVSARAAIFVFGCAANAAIFAFEAAAEIGAWRTSVVVASRAPAIRDSSWPIVVVRTAPDPFTALLPRAPRTAPTQHQLTGIASFYWQDQMTANGERFDRHSLTAAHKTLPFNSRVRVTNLVNGRSVIVRINDRGPFKPGRVIDLSEAAAEVVGMRSVGLTQVRVEPLPGR